MSDGGPASSSGGGDTPSLPQQNQEGGTQQLDLFVKGKDGPLHFAGKKNQARKREQPSLADPRRLM